MQATLSGTVPQSRYAPITVPVTIPAGASLQLINVTPQPDSIAQGPQTVTLNGGANVEYRLDAVSSGVVTITDTPAGAPPIAAWHLAKFGIDANNETTRGDTADPDHDGTVNLLEYAFGLEPLISSPGFPTADASSGYLTLSVPKNPAATDITFSIQVNDDLANAAAWTTSGTTILQDTPTLLEARDDIPVASAPQRFIRLRVTRP